jgi:hypothetical protein
VSLPSASDSTLRAVFRGARVWLWLISPAIVGLGVWVSNLRERFETWWRYRGVGFWGPVLGVSVIGVMVLLGATCDPAALETKVSSPTASFAT